MDMLVNYIHICVIYPSMVYECLFQRIADPRESIRGYIQVLSGNLFT